MENEIETMLPNGRRAPLPETEGATDAVIVDPVLALFTKPGKAEIMAVITDMGKRYGALTIAGVNDKAGFDAVYKARQHVKDVRLEITAIHKAEKEDAMEYGRKLDGAKRTLLAEIEPIEDSLQAKEDAIKAEIQAAKDASQKIINDRCAARQAALIAVDAVQAIHPLELPGMSEADFQAHLSVATTAYNAKKEAERSAAARLAELEAKEAESKAREAAALEEQRKAQAAAQAEIDRQRIENERKAAELKAESDRIETAKREAAEAQRREVEAKERAAELEKAKEAARLEGIKEAERKAKEAAEAKAKQEAEEKAKAEAKAAKAPEIEKLETFLSNIRGVQIPNIRDPKLQGVLVDFTNQIVYFDKAIQAAKV